MSPFPVLYISPSGPCAICVSYHTVPGGWGGYCWCMLVPMEKTWHVKSCFHVEDKRGMGLCAVFVLSFPVSIFLAWVLHGTPLAAFFVMQAVLAPVEVAVSAWCAFTWVPRGK